jgi:hypothetical protein
MAVSRIVQDEAGSVQQNISVSIPAANTYYVLEENFIAGSYLITFAGTIQIDFWSSGSVSDSYTVTTSQTVILSSMCDKLSYAATTTGSLSVEYLGLSGTSESVTIHEITNSGTSNITGTGYVAVIGGGAGGAGGNANAGAGGGGSGGVQVYGPITFNGTESVTIGAGGNGGAVGQNGNSGGTTTFGNLASSNGGTGGTGSSGGSGGSPSGALAGNGSGGNGSGNAGAVGASPLARIFYPNASVGAGGGGGKQYYSANIAMYGPGGAGGSGNIGSGGGGGTAFTWNGAGPGGSGNIGSGGGGGGGHPNSQGSGGAGGPGAVYIMIV